MIEIILSLWAIIQATTIVFLIFLYLYLRYYKNKPGKPQKVNLEYLKVEIKPYKHTLVLTDTLKVVKLVEVIKEPDDYYYMYEDKAGNTFYDSCVGTFYPLKGQLKKDDYNRIRRNWNSNAKTLCI